MALGGGPPMLSLLTGAAKGITEGQRMQQEREREAILNALRQQQIESTQELMRQRREDSARQQEIHDLRVAGQITQNNVAATAAELAAAEEEERQQFLQRMVPMIAADRGWDPTRARRHADQLWETGSEYRTKEQESLDESLEEEQRRVTIASMRANTASANASREARELETETAEAMGVAMTNPSMQNLFALPPTTFRTVISSYDPNEFQQVFGTTVEGAARAYQMHRDQAEQPSSRYDPNVARIRAISMAEQALAAANGDADKALADWNARSENYVSGTREERDAYMQTQRILQQKARGEFAVKEWEPGSEGEG